MYQGTSLELTMSVIWEGLASLVVRDAGMGEECHA